MIKTLQKNKILVLLILCTIVINIISTNINEVSALNIISGFMIGTSEAIVLISYIIMLNKPIISLITFSISQILLLIYECTKGLSLVEAFNDIIIILSVYIIGTLVQLIIADKKLYNKKDKENKLKRIRNDIFINIKPVKFNIIEHLIVYSLIVTAIMQYSNNEILLEYSSNTEFRIYSSIVLMLPIFISISNITVSILAYEMLFIKIIIEIYTVYSLFTLNENILLEAIYIAIEIIVLGYCIYNYKEEKEINEKNK